MKRALKIIAIAAAVLTLGGSCIGCSQPDPDKFTMRARISELGSELLVEVISAPHGNSGEFFVIYGDRTPITDPSGASVDSLSLEVGQLIEVDYGGQVMMSYPPKIAAIEIRIITE